MSFTSCGFSGMSSVCFTKMKPKVTAALRRSSAAVGELRFTIGIDCDLASNISLLLCVLFVEV